MRFLGLLSVCIAAIFLMGFRTHYFGPTIADYFEEYKTPLPKRNTAVFCIRDGCFDHHKYTYSADDIAEMRELMNSRSAEQEREKIAQSVKWLERKLGKLPTDCTAEAANVTSHMLILQRNGLLKYHTVDRPAGKWSLSRWPHWAAMIKDQAGNTFAVDSYFVPNGTLPQIAPFDNWYISANWSLQVESAPGTLQTLKGIWGSVSSWEW